MGVNPSPPPPPPWKRIFKCLYCGTTYVGGYEECKNCGAPSEHVVNKEVYVSGSFLPPPPPIRYVK